MRFNLIFKSRFLYLITFLTILINTVSVLAYKPTVESLFRNANNGNIDSNVIRANVKITYRPNSSEGFAFKNKEGENFQLYKLLFSFDRSVSGKPERDELKLLQIAYDRNDNSFNDKKIESIHFDSNVFNSFKNKKFFSSKKLTHGMYGLFFSLLLNRSEPMKSFLSENVSDFKSNDQLIRSEKEDILKKEAAYLQAVKNDSSLQGALESPFYPRAVEEKRNVRNLINQNLIHEDEKVSLAKDGNEFFLQVDYDNFKAKFTNETHQIVELSYLDGENSFLVKLNKYILYNGTHELPKVFTVKLENNDLYEIEFLELKHFKDLSDLYNREKARYQKTFSESKKSHVVVEPLAPFMKF